MILGLGNGAVSPIVPDDQIADWYALAEHVGARWVRIDATMNYINPAPTSWVWSHLDRLVAMAAGRNLRPLILLTYTAPWAAPPGADQHYADLDDLFWLGRWIAYAKAVAGRYPDCWFEVWNEPNLPSMWTGSLPDPAAYAALYAEAHYAIRTAAPHAKLVTGGLSPGAGPLAPARFGPSAFVEIAAAGCKPDGVGHHPYWPEAYGPDGWPDSAFLQSPALGRAAREVWPRVKVWATETGCRASGGEDVQDVQLRAALAYWAAWQDDGWAGPAFVYRARDKASAPDGYGLERADGVRRLAVGAVRDSSRL